MSCYSLLCITLGRRPKAQHRHITFDLTPVVLHCGDPNNPLLMFQSRLHRSVLKLKGITKIPAAYWPMPTP